MINRRSFVRYSTALSAIATLSGRIFAAEEAIRLWAPPAIPAILMAVVAARRKEAGKPVSKLDLYKGPDMLRAGLASNSMPLLLTPTYVAANFANRGKPLQMLDIVSNGFFSIVSRDAALQQMEDLQGRQIVVVHKKNTLPDIVLQILLKSAGIRDRVNVVYYTSLAETMERLTRGECDTVMIAEPSASVMLKKAQAMDYELHRVLDVQKEWGRLLHTAPHIPMVGLVVDTQFYAENTEVVNDIRHDIAEAALWCRQYPMEAAVYGQKVWPSMPSDVVENALAYANLVCLDMPSAQENLMFYYRQILALNPKLLGGSMPSEGFYG